MTDTLTQISALVGFLLPLLVAVIQQQHWSSTLRTIVGVTAICVAAIITAWAEGKLNWHDWATSVLAIFTIAQVSYHTVWKQVGTTRTIETSTSTSPPRTSRTTKA